ncbi:transmembrane protein 235 isoform X1 [Triplophysa rosa]|uniref:Transmembrane protein 235-like n=1 Tax=Triplophysa rosa TaxID=992332 RepID=A0A9W7TIS7_TRIRA|nr:transmembrane protein 235 isoform X1 [Triplophysa rosa]KAI7796764.1 putative transmembrane protein 235-like [Triplophysa rosa]
MKITFGSVVVGAGLTGVLSFSCLTLAIGSEYWYIIEDKRTNHTDPPHMHSGLWGVTDDAQSHTEASSRYSESEKQMEIMHSAIAVLLPLSVVMLVFGGICGLVSSLARSRTLLIGSASYFLLCSLLTLSGVSLYIRYSQKALEETERRVGREQMAQVHTSFGWSMDMAWLSCVLEVITGLLLLLAARLVPLNQYEDSMAPI